MSPSRRGRGRVCRAPGVRRFRTGAFPSAGNESTLVGVSLLRQARLRVRIAASSVSTTASSPSASETAAAAAAIARRNAARALRFAFQRGDATTISIRGGGARRRRSSFRAGVAKSKERERSFLALARRAFVRQAVTCLRRLERGLVVGGDDARHQLVA